MRRSGGAILILIVAVVFVLMLSLLHPVSGQTDGKNIDDVGMAFHSTVIVVIVIIFIVLFFLFVLILYVKFCSASARRYHRDNRGSNSLLPTLRSYSGIDKSIIESLPLFKFSALKGSRDGLECAVCLSAFDDLEILRLLPKCKHAFHIACIDRWLENHSSCPLCRYKVEMEDLTMFKYSGSSRFLFRDPSSIRNQSELALDLFVEREVTKESSCVLGKKGNSKDRGYWPMLAEADGKFDDRLHKLKHKIIISDAVFKNRWSDLNSSDLTSLNSDMLNDVSNRRFSTSGLGLSSKSRMTSEGYSLEDDSTISKIKLDMQRKRVLEVKAIPTTWNKVGDEESIPTTWNNSGSSITSGRRCMSEMPNLSRTMDATARTETGWEIKDDNMRKAWLPIARRTVQWFAGKERRSESTSSDFNMRSKSVVNS